MNFSVQGVAVLFVLVLLGGCATNRGYMKLELPTTSPSAVSKSKVVVIDAVNDARHFEEDPSDPSVPSLKKGKDYKLDAEQRKRAVARKRNTWGMAIGDILLDGEQTVETLVRALVLQNFERHGYRVIPGDTAAADAVHVSVTIAEFWGWFTPGLWTVDMEARIRTTLDANDAAGVKTFEVAAYGKKSALTGLEHNWRDAYERAFADYAAKFDESLEKAGF